MTVILLKLDATAGYIDAINLLILYLFIGLYCFPMNFLKNRIIQLSRDDLRCIPIYRLAGLIAGSGILLNGTAFEGTASWNYNSIHTIFNILIFNNSGVYTAFVASRAG